MMILTAYGVYLTVSVALTIWVGRTLHRAGRVFLLQAFHGNTEMAESVNHLLVVGFYLLNSGYVALALSTADSPTDARQAIELVSAKLGTVLLVLGVLHFLNLYVIHRFRHRQGNAKRYVDHILD